MTCVEECGSAGRPGAGAVCCSARTRLQWGAREAAVQAVDSLSGGCSTTGIMLVQAHVRAGSAVKCQIDDILCYGSPGSRAK